MFTYGASGSVVDVYVDKLALCMDMKGTVHLKKIFTDGCSHSSVHTMFTYASDSVVHVDVDKLAFWHAHTGYNAFKEAIHRWMFTQ